MTSLDETRDLLLELRDALRQILDEVEVALQQADQTAEEFSLGFEGVGDLVLEGARRRLDGLPQALDSHSQRLDLLEQRIAGSGHDRIVGAP